MFENISYSNTKVLAEWSTCLHWNVEHRRIDGMQYHVVGSSSSMSL